MYSLKDCDPVSIEFLKRPPRHHFRCHVPTHCVEAVNTVCLGLCHCQSVSSVSLFFFGISGIKCVQDKIFGIFYVQIHENLQICREFSEISLSKNQKKVIFARNR